MTASAVLDELLAASDAPVAWGEILDELAPGVTGGEPHGATAILTAAERRVQVLPPVAMTRSDLAQLNVRQWGLPTGLTPGRKWRTDVRDSTSIFDPRHRPPEVEPEWWVTEIEACEDPRYVRLVSRRVVLVDEEEARA